MSDALETSEQILATANHRARHDALLTLYRIGGREADAVVTAYLVELAAMDRAAPRYHPDSHAVAARVAAELDPDRGPALIVAYLAPHQRGARTSLFGRFSVVADLADPMLYPRIGVTRLRRLQPLAHYGKLLSDPVATKRRTASIALGDTADLDALTPLATACGDANHHVRREAANAVRRLRHFGAATAVPDHPIRVRLKKLLEDPDRLVALAAAQALVATGLSDDVRQSAQPLPRRRRRLLEECLGGEIPPLAQLWPGDATM